ncbi:MAG: cytochrome-c peroxidase [Bacteroidota bacterium]
MTITLRAALFLSLLFLAACTKDETSTSASALPASETLTKVFGSAINMNALPNYAAQTIPTYITKDNTGGNVITNAKATLGRVLFYDKHLSTNNTIACASCHVQKFAFGDTAMASIGVNGTTGRHSMRLINSRFANEVKFFWDERASSLENQTTRPMQDHKEMGFSGADGDPSLNDLITKLQALDYYKELFTTVYGDAVITEARMQECIAQFIRSIQSFDSKYDAGRAVTGNDQAPFANFSMLENDGKNLFFAPPQFDGTGTRIAGGAGCAGCHAGPEFDIDPRTLNNGVIGSFSGGTDQIVTRAPSLRDVVKTDGTSNGPFMHIGLSNQLITVINHYNKINPAGNTNLDPRLRPAGNPQNLNLTQQEKDALIAFIRTLAGTNVYTDTKWSDPFVK